MWSPLAPTDDAMRVLETRIALGVPLGRMSDADEVAKAALYLASDDASNVTAITAVGGAQAIDDDFRNNEAQTHR